MKKRKRRIVMQQDLRDNLISAIRNPSFGMTPLQNRVRELLITEWLKQGWSYHELERRSGVSERRMRRFTYGENVTWGTIEALCQALGVELHVSTEAAKAIFHVDGGMDVSCAIPAEMMGMETANRATADRYGGERELDERRRELDLASGVRGSTSRQGVK